MNFQPLFDKLPLFLPQFKPNCEKLSTPKHMSFHILQTLHYCSGACHSKIKARKSGYTESPLKHVQ